MRLVTLHLLPNYIDINICSFRVATVANILILRDISVIKFSGCGLEDRDLAPSKDRQTFMSSPQIPARSATQSTI
jgi:hypothetical protein